MQVGFLITNGGGHSAATWAEFTASRIADLIQIADTAAPELADQARRVKLQLQLQLFDIFEKHHGKVMGDEQKLLKTIATARKEDINRSGYDPLVYLPSVMTAVNAALAATPFAAHFAQDHVQTVLKNMIGQHTADVMHHEHLYHADRQGA